MIREVTRTPHLPNDTFPRSCQGMAQMLLKHYYHLDISKRQFNAWVREAGYQLTWGEGRIVKAYLHTLNDVYSFLKFLQAKGRIEEIDFQQGDIPELISNISERYQQHVHVGPRNVP